MAKLEVITGKQTEWGGLWWHPENNSFSSAAISLKQLRQFKGNVRLVLKKNHFFNGGVNNRPNYVFQLRDAASINAHELDVEDIEETIEEKVQRLAEVLHEANINADLGQIPSISQDRAAELFEEARQILYELTGARWEVTYTTWY